ncbi:MAG: hypothetical protein JWN93_3791 [Hyphomicrobiales bacterium]|nr:hypothetical protein [Hyphomicrobiales bacterium]
MAEDDTRTTIERLEARIDALTQTAESCRKIIVISKTVAIVGALWCAALFLTLLRFDAMQFIAGLTLAIGGLVALGSHMSTLEATLALVAECEAKRAELIGTMRLRVVTN